ncbi:DNA-binding response regulator [Paenibacillus sp. 598K]|uniref:response regulator transcription factor n=1 Tax=Paenibacillus sp. 598K TaxID=1117987 RepID=UPI000FFAFB3C|nr:helix-turn-helix domain-containing protein [Paenibacillus sp. 598K]GBF78452.1 DNA-binding response regulator [Paenibacillus sp. 598K]
MRALIVDDEARVRRAIALLVDWEAHGITEVKEAASGREAIVHIEESVPALVIMDMMMEDGHGLELMAWIAESADSTKFIVVSGHDDFDFVRSTVRHGGVDYILKPVEPEAINTAVAKATRAWREEERERTQQQRQSIQLNEFKPIYGEKLLSSIIHDPATAEAALRRLRQEGVVPPEATQARLLLLHLDTADRQLMERMGNDSDLLRFMLTNICHEFLHPDERGTAFSYWADSGGVILLLWEPSDDPGALVTKINEALLATLQRRMHFGLGSGGALPQSLPAQYSEARQALRQRNLLGSGVYLHRPTALHERLQPASFASVLDDTRVAVLSGSGRELAEAAQRWIDELTRTGCVTPEQLTQWLADAEAFRSALLRETLGEQAATYLAEAEREDREHPAPAPDSYAFSHYLWRDWAEHWLSRLSQRVASLTREGGGSAWRDMLAYVEQHYTEELALQDIAAAFGVSREYVSRRFKQAYGIGFTDYLTGYRIDRAKRLMANPHLSVARIAEMVGYRDVKYFSKVFKKQAGQSPKAYRSQLEG